MILDHTSAELYFALLKFHTTIPFCLVTIASASSLNFSNFPDEAALSLCVSITDEEVKKSLFGIGNEKAPGHDGFTSNFFKDS